MLTIQKRLVDFLLPRAEEVAVTDVRIGLGYSAVELETGHAGVAWTPKETAASCTHFAAAGNLAGRPAVEILSMFANENSSLARAVGLAGANALLAGIPQPDAGHEEIISSLNISNEDHVAMVGHFAPVVAKLKKTGCRLDIVELNPDRGQNTITPHQGKEALAACSVAIITGTTLINGTFDEVTASLSSPRAAVLLGPSSPLCGDLFEGTRITHSAGSRVTNPGAVLRVVSEGGGTMLMKPFLSFETVRTPVKHS